MQAMSQLIQLLNASVKRSYTRPDNIRNKQLALIFATS